jgi:uncharacterized protein YjbJ (UPF0337 family)
MRHDTTIELITQLNEMTKDGDGHKCKKSDHESNDCWRRARRALSVMDWNRIEGNWKQFKGRAKEKWGRLTDDDLDVINGRQDQLEGKIQERYGIAKDQAKKDVDAWFKSLPWWAQRAHAPKGLPPVESWRGNDARTVRQL